MNEALFFLLLAAVGLAWTSLPMIPAIRELKREREIKPLAIPQAYEADTRFPARAFRDHLHRELGPLLPDSIQVPASLPSGVPVFVLAENSELPVLGPATTEETPIVIVTRSITVPPGSQLIGDSYAADRFEGGDNCVYRALFAEGDITLGAGSITLRWIHSETNLCAGAGTQLYGRASAECRLVLEEGCRFERLYAPCIRFGPNQPAEPEDPPESHAHFLQSSETPDALTIIHGDVELPPNSVVDGNIVARGTLVVGRDSLLLGSVKGYSVRLHDNVRAAGSVVTEKDVTIGRGCFAHGPVIAEDDVFIGAGTVIGRAAALATITARSVYVEPGVIVRGSIWARKLGFVSPLDM